MALQTSNLTDPLVAGELNDFSRGETSGNSLISLFEIAARKHKDRNAIAYQADQITYGELNRAANRMARLLRNQSLHPGQIVAIYLDRSIEMLVAMLGVLKAGGAYLPIDPNYPSARVVQTLEDARPVLVITNQKLAAQLGEVPGQLLLLNERPDTTSEDEANPPLQAHADDLAYAMYTSGSTGKPKGVLVTHRNVVRLLTQTEPWFHFDQDDIWTMFHSFAFDFSVWEIWGPLTTGGKLVIVPFVTSRSPEDFYALLSEQKVTVLNQTPSAFSLLNQVEESGKRLPLALRLVIFGGEALQYRSLRSWFNRHGDEMPQLVNMYGITETTVHVTYRIVRKVDAEDEQDSLIGVPIPDLQIHLLGSDLLPVAEGEIGEICIGGGGVARGYLNRPELTAERFVPDPSGVPGATLYRSGDLARRRADGELVYLGRGDSQVKINGFRIELGEVEAAIADYPGVQQVCVAAHANDDGQQRLAAYFVMSDESRPTPGEISRFLSQRLPPQMLPAFYTQIEAIPLTGNGKVDRAMLPKPASGSNTASDSTAPSIVYESHTQELVAEVWRAVLNASQVGLDDNFFDIGGTSVLLVSVRTQLQQRLNRAIPVTWMFEFTTVRSIATQLSEAQAGTPSPSTAPLNAAQEQARKQREAFAKMRAARGTSR
ncbi:amino acid adenylation domain-containing protein [Edaphobacter flagellatus]|uniref:amino acid adenylation domain-containing protein n=1 Tax=Edaphobacter flagellatus TaxID=1933044 RepID=UPI0021B2462D|nr:amino acid adenylation domain-containing protein [Edaphobacter flagellatus]